MDVEEILAVILAWIYVILMIFVTFQIFRIIYYRHKIVSFQGAFLTISFFWTLLRIIFWFCARLADWNVWLIDILYALPIVCQCSTFSLLILFYAKLADPKQWKAVNSSKKANMITAYALANLTMLALTIMFAGIHANRRQNEDVAASTEYLDRIYFLSCGIYFGIISILALYYIMRLYKSASSAAVRHSKNTIFVTSLVFIIFLSRSIFDFLSAGHVIDALHVYQAKDMGTSKRLSTTAFIFFVLWEVVPSLLVLVYFSVIPSTDVAMCAAWRFQWYQFLSKHFPSLVSSSAVVSDNNYIYGEDQDTISPVLGKIRVYSQVGSAADTPENLSPKINTTHSKPINSLRNNRNDLFENPHRYSLSPNNEDDVWVYGSSYASNRQNNNSDTSRFVEQLSSHYDMTPQHYLHSPL